METIEATLPISGLRCVISDDPSGNGYAAQHVCVRIREYQGEWLPVEDIKRLADLVGIYEKWIEVKP
jgi:hypothetical protein